MPTPTVSLLPDVAVLAGGGRAPIRGEIPAAIAARLALTPGVAVTTDALVAALWSDAPDTAAVSVRVGVSKLRATALGAVLEGGRGGYRLALGSDDIDLLRLERRMSTPGDARDAAERLAELDAIEPLWGADPLTALRARPFAVDARRRFADLRRNAMDELAVLRLDAGRVDAAARAAALLVAASPLDPRPTELLARALARGGRAADALAAIDALRERMRDELGLDLTPDLDALRQAIVRQAPDVVGAGRAEVAVERHGIPLPLTRFVGREAELAALDDARAGARLVTLVGPGGVGKTRLAIESARRSSRALDDEQWMVDLAAVATPDGVLPAVAELLGGAEPTLDVVARRLSGRRTLLVLDNAEHVLDAVRDLVRRLLAGTEGLSVVVTSREALKIPGERVVAVAPMLDAALGDAERLFRERAADIRPDLDLDRDSIRRLCVVLDGMPLALELAAAQLDVLGLGEVADAVVAGASSPGMAARHASVTDAIRASVELLGAAERTLLAQLAGFAGTFRVEDAAGVCRADDLDVAVLTRRLVQKSLVASTDDPRAGRRLRVLESVKAFARDHLDPGDAAAWRIRHRAWFADVVDALAPDLRGHDAARARALLDLAAPDLQLALGDAVDAGDRTAALRIAGGQAHYWMRRGLLAEGRAALERARAVPGEAPGLVESSAVAGVALLAYQSGDPESATRYMVDGLQLAAAVGDTDRLALLHGYAAYAASLFGDRDQVEPLAAGAEAALDGAEPWVLAEVRLCQGQALRALGRPAQALDRLAEARELATRIGYGWIAVSARYVAGKVLVDVRRARDAVELLVPGARRAFLDEDPTSALALMHVVGGACALLERHRDGAVIFGAVDALGARFGYSPVRTEGQDAQAHRDRVAAGLVPGEWESALRDGARLGFDELFALGWRLLPAGLRLVA